MQQQSIKHHEKRYQKYNILRQIIYFSDKSTNIYKIDKNTYNKLLKENITPDYK